MQQHEGLSARKPCEAGWLSEHPLFRRSVGTIGVPGRERRHLLSTNDTSEKRALARFCSFPSQFGRRPLDPVPASRRLRGGVVNVVDRRNEQRFAAFLFRRCGRGRGCCTSDPLVLQDDGPGPKEGDVLHGVQSRITRNALWFCLRAWAGPGRPGRIWSRSIPRRDLLLCSGQASVTSEQERPL
jgi:hypothetical protein